MADQRPIGYWLKVVDNLIDMRFVAVLDEHGVTRRQWQLLNVLSRGPASMGELDAAVAPFLPQPIGGVPGADAVDDGSGTGSVAAEVDELVESEWVTATDVTFILTPLGDQSFERLSEVVAGIRASMTQDIGEDEYATTVRILEQMARNLGWSET